MSTPAGEVATVTAPTGGETAHGDPSATAVDDATRTASAQAADAAAVCDMSNVTRIDGTNGMSETTAVATAPEVTEVDGASEPPAGFMTAEMIADRLARVTGKRSIRPSTIRGMASRDQMPAPTDRKWGRRTLWDAAQIGSWLQEREARHVSEPAVRQIQRRLTELDEHARATGNDVHLKEGVRSAHRRGLSYQQIADAIKTKNGDHHPTREAVRARFQRYL